MCGICGFISDQQIGHKSLKRMNDSISHRGPDDSGEEIYEFGEQIRLSYARSYKIGLAQRRLSILDLTQRGHQPFHSPDNTIILVFNGEIYNYNRLKEEISEYPFCTDCDTEVIVAAYQKWGRGFVDHIFGMFAIALYDRLKGELILVRDRVGKKPLYYAYNGKDFVFASTLKPIMLFPNLKKELNMAVVPRFLLNQYITGEDCIFQNTYKVKPGQMVIFTGNCIEKKIYWDYVEEYIKNSSQPFSGYEKSKKKVTEQIINAVKDRLVADVPVGTFLSGGYDSSLITAIAQSLCEKPVKTFSIGFEEKGYDEAKYAKTVADYLGTDHTEYYVSEREMLQLIDSIPDYYDEPFADSSQIPSMLVAKIAREQVSVVLTGDGGDEVFCGYRLYDKLKQAQSFEPVARVLRMFLNEHVSEKMPFALEAILNNREDQYKTQFGREEYKRCILKMLNLKDSMIYYNESKVAVENWQIRRMLLDSVTYLPDDNLCKVDRATMRYSLEARNPLLSIGVLEAAFRTPHIYKYYKGDKKHILKDITYGYIPQDLLDRPKKGFSIPKDKWLRSVLKEELLSLTSKDYLVRQNIFQPEYTSQFVRNYVRFGDQGAFSGANYSNIIWPLYMFQKWYQRYMDN